MLPLRKRRSVHRTLGVSYAQLSFHTLLLVLAVKGAATKERLVFTDCPFGEAEAGSNQSRLLVSLEERPLAAVVQAVAYGGFDCYPHFMVP